ncbi:twin-arginine translocase TatA/TatE family subunit [Gemmatimonadota bacterium]
MSFGVLEILLVLVLVVFFFGAKRIPLIARGVGEGIRNFRKSVREDEGEDRFPDGSDEDPRLPGGQDS